MRKFKRVNNQRFGICVLVFVLIMSQAGITKTIHNNDKDIKFNEIKLVSSQPIVNVLREYRKVAVSEEKLVVTSEEKPKLNKISKDKKAVFTITAYDLSIQATGKSRGDKAFGITKDGTDIRGKSRIEAMVISADSRIIPLGTKVELKFINENYKKYDGIYTNRDSGSAIKNHKIDLFIGDFQSAKPSKKAIIFGKTTAYVTILDN